MNSDEKEKHLKNLKDIEIIEVLTHAIILRNLVLYFILNAPY